MKVRYLGRPQTIAVGDSRIRVRPGDELDLEDPDKVLRDKLGRRLWEAVEP